MEDTFPAVTDDFAAHAEAYAEESMASARRAMDDLMHAAARSSDRVEESRALVGDGLLALQGEAMRAFEANLAAAFDHGARLAAARTPDEIWRLNHDFVIERMRASSEQSVGLARAAADLAGRFGTHLRERL